MDRGPSGHYQTTVDTDSTVIVHQDPCIDCLREALIPTRKDTDSLVGPDRAEYRSVLGKLGSLPYQLLLLEVCIGVSQRHHIRRQGTQQSGENGEGQATEVTLCSFAWASRVSQMLPKNNSDGIFICQPRNKERNAKASFFESYKIRRTVLSTTVAELYAFMKR